MIKSITVTNHRDEELYLQLTDPYSTGLAITSIEGLDPPKADINTTELVTNDGSVFNSARITTRNIVFTFKLLPVPTMESVRVNLYKYFPIKKQVSLLIETDLRTCSAYGYVESVECNQFSDSVQAQVSILCADPYIYAGYINETVFSGTQDSMEFQIPALLYSTTATYAVNDLCIYNNKVYKCNTAVTTPEEFNPSKWTEYTITNSDIGFVEFPVNDPIEFSDLVLDTIKVVNYEGEIDTGIVINIGILDNVGNIRVWNYYTGEQMILDATKISSITGGALQTGDQIEISTIIGSKYVTLTRSGTTYNILNAVNKDADWFQITIGENVLCYAVATGSYTDLQMSIDNPVIYQGI